tara:strand:+ start:133 stop:342 length:210 start_codon:yes stop_codon:yes gene_type:complete
MKTTINSIEVEVYTISGQTFCDLTKGRYTGSLSATEDEGCLWDSDWEQSTPVSASTIAKIEAFALKHGW